MNEHSSASQPPPTEFPVNISAIIYVNGNSLGEAAAAKIVKYKKHKRPDHFNFWITGLQKCLSVYNDVRLEGVAFESEGCLRISLVSS
jgi:hypothetical protein